MNHRRSSTRGALLAIIAVAAVTACTAESREIPLPLPATAETSAIFDDQGNVITTLLSGENRVSIPLSMVPETMQNAIVSIEDRRFWQHNGVDPRAIARAVARNSSSGEVAQGGSTLTQQYVKIALLNPERTMQRKVEEAALALEIERTYSKERILELYLNTVFFGNHAYGIEAGSGVYFGIPAAQLNLQQSATLAGIVQSPTRHNPFKDPKDVLKRRNQVLKAMLDEGYIDKAEYDAAVASPLGLSGAEPPKAPTGYLAPHFVEAVKEWILGNPTFGATVEDRRQQLYGGGLKIYTTIDPVMQREAEASIRKYLPSPGKSPDAALVSIDPKTGYVKAMVGGYDFWGTHSYAKVNLAMGTGRPTGSTFKQVTLAAALARGIKPTDKFPSPQSITFPGGTEPWRVTGGGGLNGEAELRQCAENSSNTCFANLSVNVLGPETIRDMGYNLGISKDKLKDSDGKTYGPITLGPYNTTVLEMAGVDATFANQGVYVPPAFVSRVVRSDGTVLYQHQHTQRKALEPEVAYQVSDILTGVILRGTGKQNGQIGRPAAGKTGTVEVDFNQANTDIWFCGYTPDLATAVWVGYAAPEIDPDTGKITRLPDLGNRQGGDEPTAIWADFMKQALANTPPTPFLPPSVPKQVSAPLPEIRQFTPVEPPNYVQMPDLTNMSANDAQAALTGLGLNPEVRASQTPPNGKPGVVVAQSPKAGYELAAGADVTIEVTEGAPVAEIAVPSLLGTPVQQATDQLTAAGYSVELTAGAPAAGTTRPDGTPLQQNDVWGQTPQPGEKAVDGKVQLYYQP